MVQGKFNRSICPQCKRVFVRENDGQICCSTMCLNVFSGLSSLGMKVKTFECLSCGSLFKNLQNKKYCSDHCREHNKALMAKQRAKDQSERLKALNEKKKVKPPKKRKVSYEELNRRSEYRRVWDDHGWDRYLKGKNWDLI